jgi:hypothetical protein
VALTTLVPLPALKTQCGPGCGLAACPALGLLVTSEREENTLSVWDLPGGPSDRDTSDGAWTSAGASAGGASAGGGGGGLRLVCTLGGAGSVAPMQFKFNGSSGRLAFTFPSSSGARPLLLVTDAGHDAVHLVDVMDQTHAGYLASPGSIAGPRGVAASEASYLVAVSAWKETDSGDNVVVVYRGSGAVWEAVRVIGGGFGGPRDRDGQLRRPHGLRFSGDGSTICVADWGNNRASVFRVADGGFVRHMEGTGLGGPSDVEKVEGGWLAACWGSHRVEFVGDGSGDDGGGWPSLGKTGGGYGSGDGEFCFPSALAAVPGLGLVVREAFNGGRLQVFGQLSKRDMPGLDGRVGACASTPPAPVEEDGGDGGGGGGGKRVRVELGGEDDGPAAVAGPALAPDLDRAVREVGSGTCLRAYISEAAVVATWKGPRTA